jgi:hypothetical protein
MSSLQLSRGFTLNQAKPWVNRHFFLSMGQKLSSLRTSCGNLQDWRCMNRWSWSGKIFGAWLGRRSQMPATVSLLSTRHPMLPWLQCKGEVIQHRWFSPPSHARWDRASQAQLVMGRALHHRQSYKTRVVSTTITWWLGGIKLLEYQALTAFLSLDNLYPKLSAAAQHLLSIKRWSFLQMTTFPSATLQELGGCGHEY